MAVNYIEVDTGVLQRDTGDIQDSINTVDRNLKAMFEGIQTLNGMWKGTANSVFNAQFNNDYRTMENILKEMQAYIEALDRASFEYNKCENEVGDIVKAIRI